MKKVTIFLLMVFLCLGSISLSAQKREIDEGFETTNAGALPSGWTQGPAAAAKKWAVEKSNFSNPAACASGTGRIKLVSGTQGAAAQEVLLISPVVDNTRLSQPILVFDYASVRMNIGSKPVDSLRVYYRVRSDRDWALLKEYGEADNWKHDTIDIPDKSKTLQLAFGGVDNGSFGVVLDNIILTGRPVCKAVTNVAVYNKTHEEAKIRWAGELNTTYHVKIATKELADPENATEADGLFLEKDVVSATVLRINAAENKALSPTTTYYYYIQSDCGFGDVSPWVKGSFTSACLPVESFATSFDAPSDIDCWTMIGESHGQMLATVPTNVHTEMMEYVNSDGEPGYVPGGVDPDPYSGASNLMMIPKTLKTYKDDYVVLYAVSPRLADNVDLKKMQLSFRMKMNTQNINLRLIVSDYPDDFSNAKESGLIVGKSTYEYFTVTFEDITSTGKYVAFKIDASENILTTAVVQVPRVDIDDIELAPLSECSNETRVTMFNQPEISGSTATLAWNRQGATKYNVKVTTSVINPAVESGNVFDRKVDNPTITIKDLIPATRYYYYVQPICANNVEGAWSNMQTFDSECPSEGAELPFRENFDYIKNTGVGVMPPCWSTKIPPGATSSSPYVNTFNRAYSAPNFLTSYGQSLVVLPKINADLKNCQIRFMYGITETRVPVEVGVMTDPADENSFVAIKEFAVDQQAGTMDYKWTRGNAVFDSYTGNGKYVAFRMNTELVSYYFDDIVVEDKSSCANPSDLHSVSATTTSITMDWTASEQGEAAWDIAYVKSGAPFSAAQIVDGITEHPYELKGLTENTSYDIYLRAVCGEGAVSSWLDPVKMKVNSPARMPYFCDFENVSESGAWNLINGTYRNQWIIGNAIKDEQIDGKAVGRTAYISTDYGTTNKALPGEEYVYATRLFDFDKGELIDFEFDWRLPGAEAPGADWSGRPWQVTRGILIPFLVPEELIIQSDKPGALYQLTGAIGPNPSQGIKWENSIPEGWIRLCDGIGYLTSQTEEWHHHKYTYPLRKGGRYNLVIVFITPRKFNDYDISSAAIDNVSVKQNTTDCIAPVDLLVHDITQSTAKVSFLNYNADKWKVVLATSALDTSAVDLDAVTPESNESVIYSDEQPDNPLQFSGLEPETPYYVYFRPSCGSDGTWVSKDFSTICQAHDVPLKYSFNDDEEEFQGKTFMDCWRHIPVEMSKYAPEVRFYKFPSYDKEMSATNNTQMLFISSGSDGTTDTYAVSPEMEREMNKMMVSFRVTSKFDYAARPLELEVGAMTDPLDPATFELIESVRPLYKGQWKTFYVYFDNYTGTGKHVALRLPSHSGYSSELYVDDLVIDTIKGCVPAREITVENITSSTADVSWGVVGPTGDYHVKVTTSPLGRWEDKANVYDDTIVGANKVQLTGLRASKFYYVYVRTVCTDAEEGYSVGMSDTKFRTECPQSLELPYFEDFDSYELNSFPECWIEVDGDGSNCSQFNSTNLVGLPYKQMGRLSLVLRTGNRSLFPALLALPPVEGDIRELGVSFKAMQWFSGDQLVVGVLADLDDAKTFVPMDTINNAATYVWEDRTVDFADYTGNGKYVAFFLKSSYYGSSFVIDNVMVRRSRMSCVTAVAPKISNITPTSATVLFNDNDVVDAFELKVATDEINPELEPGDVVAGAKYTDLNASLTDLDPATKYYVYTRNNCGSDEDVSYWSEPTVFTTLCENPEAIPYRENFTGYGDIADQGFFPVCWRNRVITYGSVNPDIQPEPYIENSARQSMYMKAAYDKKDKAYAVVDVVTPVIEFGEAKAAGHMMKLAYKSSVKNAPIYVGLMSDPSDATTFVAYDTLRTDAADTWETQIVNFFYHKGDEQHIAFRINSLDAVEFGDQNYAGYWVNITDIEVLEALDCMPPYRAKVDLRPDRAFISWVPGDANSEDWVYYYSSNKVPFPFTDEEFLAKGGKTKQIVETKETSVVLNGLKDKNINYFYVKNKNCDFYPKEFNLSSRPYCGMMRDLSAFPVVADFQNSGLGIGDEPKYSSYFDCWYRQDDFVGDTVAYPYINNDAELLFHTVADSSSFAYLLDVNSSCDSVFKYTQLRFTAKALAEGASAVIGFAGRYQEGRPAVQHFDMVVFDTIPLTAEYAEYTVEFEDFVWVSPDESRYYNAIVPVMTVVGGKGDMVVNSINWELIPHCYTPQISLKSHDKTSFVVEWEKLDDQDRWEVAYGKQGFDLGNFTPIVRTEPEYSTVNLDEGTPYEFFVRSNCGNGMTSDWGRLCVTTDQIPATYPYNSADFADATFLASDDTLYYAYRTINLPAGPHYVSFDWKTAAAEGAFLRVFAVPTDVMITADAMFGITETTAPEGWIEIATLRNNAAWTTSANNSLYIKSGLAGDMNILFVWSKGATAVGEAVRNVKVGESGECTVPDELSVYQVTSTSAALTWRSYNATNWDLMYYETALGEDAAERVYDAKPGHQITGLKAETDYTFKVVSVCKPGQYSDPYTFTTACGTADALFEVFNGEAMPNCWSQYHGLFDEVVSDPSKLVLADDLWNINSTVTVLGSSGTPHARLTIAGDDCAHWLVSPAVKLDVNSALSFDLAFTSYNGQQNVQTLGQTDDRFIVAVSTDEGRTWTKEDATVWNNAQDVNKRLNLIGNHARRIEIDLSKYTGQTIRVAFYGESTVEFETNDIHVDSVRIDCREIRKVEDKTCQGYSYYANGFEIEKANLTVPGVYSFARVEYSETEGQCDETVLLTLTVGESKTHEYSMSVCSDTPYSDENFTNLTKTGTYDKAFPTASGCDSTVILYLTVNQAYEHDRELTIDASKLPFKFECHEFPVGTVSGEYVVECTTAAGCDSIINLKLTVNGGTAVDNVALDGVLTLTPNPVRGGELITVSYEFSDTDANRTTLRIFNSLGQIVATDTPTAMPIVFNAPYVAGVYTLQIITADNRVLTGRFIVE